MVMPERLLESWDAAGGDRRILNDPEIGHLVVNGHRIASAKMVPGLMMDNGVTENGIDIKIRVQPNAFLPRPVHLCIGLLGHAGLQRILLNIDLSENSKAHFITHCVFPSAKHVCHIMDAKIRVGPEAEMRLTESHFHGSEGGIVVRPKARVTVDRGGRYFSEFRLTTGLVGELDADYDVLLLEDTIAELIAKVFGHGKDRIRLRERIVLSGKRSRGLIRSRLALEDDARAEVIGISEGNAADSRGHVDCLEIVKDRAVASAVPVVKVCHPGSKITHEAAIGSVDRRQLETLMAHGLTTAEAVQLIVEGLLN